MKLYKVEITSLPNGSFTEDGWAVEGWEPEGWAEQCTERWGEHREFWWPSTKRLYQSRSGARDRAALIESYGATAEVIESEPVVWMTERYKRDKRRGELQAELDGHLKGLSRLGKELGKLDDADRAEDDALSDKFESAFSF